MTRTNRNIMLALFLAKDENYLPPFSTLTDPQLIQLTCNEYLTPEYLATFFGVKTKVVERTIDDLHKEHDLETGRIPYISVEHFNVPTNVKTLFPRKTYDFADASTRLAKQQILRHILIEALAEDRAIEFLDDEDLTDPRVYFYEDENEVRFVNFSPSTVEALEAVCFNGAEHVRRYRISKVFRNKATSEELNSLGITAESLGTDRYTEFLQKMINGQLTNQYIKSVIPKEEFHW